MTPEPEEVKYRGIKESHGIKIHLLGYLIFWNIFYYSDTLHFIKVIASSTENLRGSGISETQ